MFAESELMLVMLKYAIRGAILVKTGQSGFYYRDDAVDNNMYLQFGNWNLLSTASDLLNMHAPSATSMRVTSMLNGCTY